jgi:hypothetical protein
MSADLDSLAPPSLGRGPGRVTGPPSRECVVLGEPLRLLPGRGVARRIRGRSSRILIQATIVVANRLLARRLLTATIGAVRGSGGSDLGACRSDAHANRDCAETARTAAMRFLMLHHLPIGCASPSFSKRAPVSQGYGARPTPAARRLRGVRLGVWG